MMRILLIGPPGAGKGTQANKLHKVLGVPHISSGELFRDHLAAQTELGRQAKRYLDAGELVPDSVTNGMVFRRLAEADARPGFLLDGYPRTAAQAQALRDVLENNGLCLDAVLEFRISDETLTQRLLSRGRSDDTEDVIGRRLTVYHAEAASLRSYYRNIVRLVDADGPITDITERALSELRASDRVRRAATHSGPHPAAPQRRHETSRSAPTTTGPRHPAAMPRSLS